VTEVVEHGTARRVKGAFRLADKTEITVGGKTGTGDNRIEVFGQGGHLIRSKAVSRTATFAFYIGERWFGVITAYVPGQSAQNYNFTSALPVQILRNLAPELNPYIDPVSAKGCVDGGVPEQVADKSGKGSSLSENSRAASPGTN
jgi:hypothetical protein